MTSSTSLRLAARLARREVRRRPWRTALVALLVALPVAGMTVATGFVRTDRFDARQEWATTWGASTDIGVNVASETRWGATTDSPDAKAAIASLPPGSQVVSWRNAYAILRTVDRQRAQAEVVDLPIAGPIGRDVVQVVDGEMPDQPNEVLLTRSLARELGIAVGDVLDLERPDRLSWRVTGLGERRMYWGAHTAFVAPGTPFPWDARPDIGVSLNYAVDLPEGVTRQQLRALTSEFGSSVLAPSLRASVPAPPSKNREVAWTWVVGAIVLTVMGIVIASAFAAGARRQLTTLGQLAANGAGPSVLRRVLFLQGTWTGVLGALFGLALGGAALIALAPYADPILSRDVDPWDVRALDLVPVFLLGVAAATVAAMIPARSTVRVPVLAALAGRRPLSRVPRWVTGAGAAASIGGLGLLGLAVLGGRDATHDTELWALTAIVGGMAVLLGACAMAPAYVSVLEPLAARVGGSWRLAARSLARQRTRTSAVVSGVCAASALAVGAAALVLSMDAEDRSRGDMMRADEVHVGAEVTRTSGTGPNPQFSSEPVAAPRDLVESLRSAVVGAEVHEVAVVQPPTGLRWHVDQSEEGMGGDDAFAFAYGPGMFGAAVFDGTSERVYGLRSEHRAILEKEGVLVLGRADVAGELLLLPGDHPDVVPPGAGGTSAGAVGPRGNAPTTRHPVTVVDGRDYSIGALPRLLVVPSAVGRIGFVPRAPITVIRAPEALTRAQATAVQDIINDYRLDTTDMVPGNTQLNVFTEVLHPDDRPDPLVLEALLTGTALLFSLFVVAVSLALAASETRDERDVLTVAGAPPATMWSSSGRKAALLTALGGALAVPVGFLPVVVFILASDPTPPLVFPWRVTVLLLLAVPLLAGLATGAASAFALRVRPVRISTMAFD